MEKEKIPQTAREKVKNIVKQLGFEAAGDELDLRSNSYEEVMKFFHTLMKSGGVVFHGTNAEERFDTLEAREAHDSAKESGNKKAVYADEGIGAPLIAALLNKKYLRGKFGSFITGWSGDAKGKMVSKVTTNVYELFKADDQNLFSDGYIYVLDKDNFVNAEDAGLEWHSEVNQKPVLSCRISKKLAEDIFIVGKGEFDTVIEYTPEEMKEMDERRKNIQIVSD